MAYLNRAPSAPTQPVKIGLIGSGWMGAFHAESIARRVPGAELAAIADPNVESAAALASVLGAGKVTADAADILADPEIDAVIIASPARFHSSLIAQAAAAGKHVFCEKPAGQSLDELDAALAAVDAAGVHFQIGFNRRYAADFQAAKKDLAAGTVGTPQLLRSLTRDPGRVRDASRAGVPAWTVFLETLIHDFDTLNWFNEGAEPVEVYAIADALVEPGLRGQGFLDTAVVTIRYSNGAIAVAEANFSALYGYDIRGEVFGSKGMVAVADGHDCRVQEALIPQAGLHERIGNGVDLHGFGAFVEPVEGVEVVDQGFQENGPGRDPGRVRDASRAGVPGQIGRASCRERVL